MALAACALWLAGVEVLPAVHEALHDRLAPHHHHGGSIVTVSFEDATHRHPDGTIHYVAPRPRAIHPPTSDGTPRATEAFGHAAGLAHHAAALAPAAPPVTEPLPVDRRPILVAAAQILAVVERARIAATARGPPTLA